MNGDNNYKLSDDLIREALHRDFELIKLPPAEKAWRRIETGLERGPKSVRSRPRYSWSRYALAAAACLLIALGGLGILRLDWFGSPLADADLQPAAPAEEIAILEMDREEELFLLEEDVRRQDVPGELFFPGEPDPLPPDWPQTLNDHFILDQPLILTAGSEPYYRGAVYLSPAVSLLMVKSRTEGEEVPDFVDHLGRHMEAEPLLVDRSNGYYYFEAAEQPGLAWRRGDRNQALLVLSGTIEFELLKKLADQVD